MIANEWVQVLHLLTDRGFVIVQEDRETGRITVMVPEPER